MKKLIAFALVVIMLFAFASCNLPTEKPSDTETDTTTDESTTALTTEDESTTDESTTELTTEDESTTDESATDGNNDTPSEKYEYIAFTSSEEQMFIDLFGEAIPFIPNNEYYVEEYSTPLDYTIQKGIIFITYDNTQEEFDVYRELFSHYTFSDSYVDDSGNTTYRYAPADVSYAIMMSYSESEGRYVVRVDVYCVVMDETAGNGTGIPYDKLITNEGAGLPSDPDGVYDVDFTKGEYIKDVSNQSLYMGGCPTTGSSGVLIIPVQFSDVTAESKGYTTDTLREAFSKGGKTDYFSVYDYYYISSYGQLALDITLLDFWFTPAYESEYYSQFSFVYEGEVVPRGEQLILNEALDYLDDIMDLSQFDSDNNGTIDAVVLINTLEIDSSNFFYWAFRHFNFYRDEANCYYEYDGVHAQDYLWAPYQFLYEVCDEQGNTTIDNITAMNTHTFIHEFGHVLGLDDYYDYAGISSPLYGRDLMDSKNGDHNPYSKFNLGWLTTSRLVVTDGSITLTLEDFSKSGDTIILANNWDDTLGAYQEYYVLVYYTNHGLNVGDYTGYFDTEGVLVYHVNAEIYMENGKNLYDVYTKNTYIAHEYGTKNNLVEFVVSDTNWVYGVGDTMPTVIDDYGNELMYSFTVDALTSDYATITFCAK